MEANGEMSRYQGTGVLFLEEHRKQFLFEYAAVINSCEVAAPNRVIVRTFDLKFLQDGNICSDFLNILQCPMDPVELRYPENDLNVRPPLEWSEILRACNAAGNTTRAARLMAANPVLAPGGRQRTEAYYYHADVRDYVLTNTCRETWT